MISITTLPCYEYAYVRVGYLLFSSWSYATTEWVVFFFGSKKYTNYPSSTPYYDNRQQYQSYCRSFAPCGSIWWSSLHREKNHTESTLPKTKGCWKKSRVSWHWLQGRDLVQLMITPLTVRIDHRNHKTSTINRNLATGELSQRNGRRAAKLSIKQPLSLSYGAKTNATIQLHAVLYY